MKSEQVSLSYVNNLVYELEKAFWDERGRGARFRMTTVGREYFRERCLPLLVAPDADELLKTIGEVLREDGIVQQVTRSSEGQLIRIRVEGCIHRAVEAKMTDRGIEPFTCLPANLLALAVEEKLDRPMELAQIKLEEGACQLLMVLFDRRPSLD
jgi:hypothetical protein